MKYIYTIYCFNLILNRFNEKTISILKEETEMKKNN